MKTSEVQLCPRADAADVVHQITSANAKEWLAAVNSLGVRLDHMDSAALLSFFDTTPTNLRRMYDLFDLDHGSTVSRDEVKAGLHKHLGFTALNSDPQAVDSESHRQQEVEKAFDAIFHLADKDGDGVIKRNEFQGMMRCLLQSMADKNIPVGEDGDDSDPACTRMGQIEYSVRDGSLRASFRDDINPNNEEELKAWEQDFWFGEPNDHFVRWVSVLGTLGQRSALRLAVKFGLHPQAVEDLLMIDDQTPKVDRYETHYLLIVPVIRLTKQCREHIEQSMDERGGDDQYNVVYSKHFEDPYPKVETEMATLAIVLLDENTDEKLDTLLTVHGDWHINERKHRPHRRRRNQWSGGGCRGGGGKGPRETGFTNNAAAGAKAAKAAPTNGRRRSPSSHSISSMQQLKVTQKLMAMRRSSPSPRAARLPAAAAAAGGGGGGVEADEGEDTPTFWEVASTFSDSQFLRSVTNERSRLRQGNVHRLLYEILDTGAVQII